MTDYQKQQIIEMYPTMSGVDIGRAIGLTGNYVNWFAKKNGLCHNQETLQQMKRANASIAAHTKDSYKKAAMTRQRTYKAEQLRLMSGMDKKTRIIISLLSVKCRRRMKTLCHDYNYFRDPDINKAVVYYDSETRRNAFAEKYAQEKYGIKFINADE